MPPSPRVPPLALAAWLAAAGALASDVVIRDEGGVRITHGPFGTRYEITTEDPGRLAAIAAGDRDENVRFAAVMALFDREQLRRLARSASDRAVREVAARKLSRVSEPAPDPMGDGLAALAPDELARVARHDPALPRRTAAIRRLADQRLLADIAAFDPSAEARAAALETLRDEALLRDLARNSSVPEIRSAAAQRLGPRAVPGRAAAPFVSADGDPRDLVDVALDHPDAASRLQALEGIRDVASLARVAEDSVHPDTRARALSNFALAWLRWRAGPREPPARGPGPATPPPPFPLPDETFARLMRDAASHADNPGARETAAGWIVDAVRGDQPALVAMARSDPTPSVRSVAVRSVRDVAERLAIARNDADPEVRRVALDRRFGEAALTAIATGDAVPIVRSTAAKMLGDQRTLARIARRDPDTWVRFNAVTHVEDQAVLRDIARRDPEAQVRMHAVARLTDGGTLAAIAKSERDPRVRAAVERRLRELAAGPPRPR